MHHGRGVGFFTTVAGTCVLGTQFLLIGGAAADRVLALWFSGSSLWAVLTYGIFTVLTVKAEQADARRRDQRRLAAAGRRRAIGRGARRTARRAASRA